ncbi:winged helix-turn-helix domain-containing protein [Sphingomonas humi]
MSNGVLEFEGFRLEPAERRLTRDGAVVDISGRYLDALLLLARRPGELVTKDRFMAEVWRGVPVTDEALTQCIRSLRRALGDEASRPRFIETVPRHGYRFVADVQALVPGHAATAPTAAPACDPSALFPDSPSTQTSPVSPPSSHSSAKLKDESPLNSWSGRSQWLLIAAAGLVGGAGAGLVGGIAYGMLAATDPPSGTGAISILLVMTCLCVLIGLLGGLAVGSGAALGRVVARGRLFPLMAGGAFGGLMVGALGRLIGLDAFSLLIGTRPLAITGGSEGLIIGAIAGVALWLVERDRSGPTPALVGRGALLGAIAGLLVTLGGGRLMAGSLAGLAATHPDAPLARLLGGTSPLLVVGAGAVEGAIFIAALTLAFALVLRGRFAA